MAIPVGDRAVAEHTLQPQVISRPAQGGHRRTVARKRVIELSEQVEDCGALCLRPRSARAMKIGQRGSDLVHSLTRSAADAQREGQPYPRLRGQAGRSSPVAQADRQAKVANSGVDVIQMHGGDPQCPLGDRFACEVVPGPRLLRELGCDDDRFARIGLCEPQHLIARFSRLHARSLARNHAGRNPPCRCIKAGTTRLRLE